MLRPSRPHPAPQPRAWPSDKPKPKLPVVQLPIYRVHHTALEEFLAQVYRMREFDFLTATGFMPGSVPEYDVRDELPPAWDCKMQADQIRAGRRTRNVALILTCLCIDGFIPPGKYLIDTKKLPSPIQVYRSLLERTGDPLNVECVAYREKHRDDPAFAKQAAALDRAVVEWLKSQEKPVL
jgi:hypothetical protein